MTGFPVLVEEITPDWLGEVLGGEVTGLGFEPVGTGQIGTCYRLDLEGDDVPERVVVKLPVVDPAARAMVAGAYRGEARFYRDIAASVTVRTPRCHHVDFTENGDFILVMEDLAPARQGDQIAGCSVAQAYDAVRNLAGLHGPRWSDPTLLELDGLTLNGPDEAGFLVELFGPAIEMFLDDIGPQLDARDHDLLRSVAQPSGQWLLGRADRFGLVHGDYRLDNLLFPPDGGDGCVAVDWQTLSLALPARDLAYFVATSLEPDVRREHERGLVAAYHAALGPVVTGGYSLEACWDDYAFSMVQVPMTSVFGQVYGTSTDRGDRMFAAMVARGCAAMRDLDTLARI